MKLDEITLSAPPYAVALSLNHRPADEDEKLPEEAHGWPNVQQAYRIAAEEFVAGAKPADVEKAGAGLVMVAGGIYLAAAYVSLAVMKDKVGSKLPGQIFYLGKDEMDDFHRKLFARWDIECTDLESFDEWNGLRLVEEKTRGWLAKPAALRFTKFRHAAAFDADAYAVKPPEDHLLNSLAYLDCGAVFFNDNPTHDFPRWKWELFGVAPKHSMSVESGEMAVDTLRHGKELALALWLNDHADYYYRWFWGDKETFPLAWSLLNTPHYIAKKRMCVYEGQVIVQYGLGECPDPLVVHRCRAKPTPISGEARSHLFWNTMQAGKVDYPYFPDLPCEGAAQAALRAYQKMIVGA